MPSTFTRFISDMTRLGLAYHYHDDDKSYDIYAAGQVVYTAPQGTVWRGWNDGVLEEVMTAVIMYKVFG